MSWEPHAAVGMLFMEGVWHGAVCGGREGAQGSACSVTRPGGVKCSQKYFLSCFQWMRLPTLRIPAQKLSLTSLILM